jgi:hypothetical protein
MTKARDIASASLAPAGVTSTELGYIDGVTSAIQTQLNQKPEFAAGKNKIINGDFGVWQRGTSFSNPANATYTADRWFVELDGTSFTRTISQQTFTPGTAPVAGYEGTYFLRWNTSVAGTSNTIQALSTRLEDIRTFAGQTVTLSFWAKADASRALTVYAYQQSTGGSGTVTTTVGSATLTTSWARYTMTVALPSMAGVTIGTNSNLQIRIAMPTGTTMTCDFWGMQLEAGSSATAFQTATGSIQGELAACQRYFQRIGNNGGAYYTYTCAAVEGTSTLWGAVPLPVTMRTTPSMSATASGNTFTFLGYGNVNASFIFLDAAQSGQSSITMGSNTLSGLTVNSSRYIRNNNDTTGTFISLSAEL